MIGNSALQPSIFPRDGQPSVRGTFATVDVFRDAAPVLPAWAELERTAPCSIYQTRAWLLPWLDTLAPKARLRPLFLLARDASGEPVALLCLGVVSKGPVRIASFLGGKDSNFNLALIRSGRAWTPTDLRRLFREASKALGRDAPHLFLLTKQPFHWHGADNPFAGLAHQSSPSDAYGTALPADAEQLFAAKLSMATRKKLRKKEAKLASLGPLEHVLANSADERARILDAFLAQKLARFRERGIASELKTPEMRAFLEAASAPDGSGIELHALVAGERIVATYGGASHAGQWSGMVNSFEADPEIARSSPGDLLLMRIIAKACADGLSRFDLGVGEARYKAALCDEPIALFDSMVALGVRGRLYGALFAAAQQAKRRIKRNPTLMSVVKRLRVSTGGR